MPALEDVNTAELLIVARHQGQISVWTSSKRNIAAFHDPRVWESLDVWTDYFQRSDDEQWGPVGYGLIVVDYDTHQVLSQNDYSTPSSFFLIPDNVDYKGCENPSLAPLRALAKRPDQWSQVVFDVSTVSGQPLTLDQIVPASADEETFIAALTLKRGVWDLGAHGKYMIANGTYLPDGWVQQDDLGKEMPEWLIQQLYDLHARQFPAPQWSEFDDLIEQSDVPPTQEKLDAFIEESSGEDSFDEWERSVVAASRSYLRLKDSWSKISPAPRKSRTP